VAADLPENDRATLAGLVIDSLEGPPDPDIEAAWATEIERRVAVDEAGSLRELLDVLQRAVVWPRRSASVAR
jgi:hypothetical protein